jgi:hypothetical protein
VDDFGLNIDFYYSAGEPVLDKVCLIGVAEAPLNAFDILLATAGFGAEDFYYGYAGYLTIIS